MARNFRIWASLGFVYALFLGWHVPWQPPLTDAEVSAISASSARQGPEGFWDVEGFQQLLQGDDGRPFSMVNLIQFRVSPDYPVEAELRLGTVAAANAEYGGRVLRLLLARGSYPVWILDPLTPLLNSFSPALANIDNVSVVRYRSRRDLLDMITSEAFAEAEVHKWASVERTLVVPSAPVAGVHLGILVPLALFGIGCGATLVSRSRRRT